MLELPHFLGRNSPVIAYFQVFDYFLSIKIAQNLDGYDKLLSKQWSQTERGYLIIRNLRINDKYFVGMQISMSNNHLGLNRNID